MTLAVNNKGGRVLAYQDQIDGRLANYYQCGCHDGEKTYHALSYDYQKNPRLYKIYKENFSGNVLLGYTLKIVDVSSWTHLQSYIPDAVRASLVVWGGSLAAYTVTSLWARSWSRTRSAALAGAIGGALLTLANTTLSISVRKKITDMMPKLNLIPAIQGLFAGVANQEEARVALAQFLIARGIKNDPQATDQEIVNYVKQEWDHYFTHTCNACAQKGNYL